MAQVQLTNEFTNVNKLEQRVLAEGYWKCLERVQEVVNYAQKLDIKQANLLERVEYWLARDSSLLGAGPLWPGVLPGLFYQQLHNRALEDGYQLSGTKPDARWVRQLSRVGAEDQSLLREFRHPAGVTSVAFSPDSRLVTTGCEDFGVRIWDASSGQMVQMLLSHSSPITSVAFSPDGNIIATCSFDTDALLWNVLNGQIIRVFHGHGGALCDVMFSPDGKYIVTRSDDRTVRVWDVATGGIVALFVGDANWMKGLAFSPDSKQIAIGSSNEITIWDRDSEQIVATLEPDQNALSDLEANLVEDYINIGSDEIVYRDIRSGEIFSAYPEPERMQPMSIAFSPDGQLVSAGSYQSVYFWDIGQHDFSHPFSARYFSSDTMYNNVSGTVFSSDGKLVALIRDEKVTVFQVQHMYMILVCGHSAPVTSVAYTFDCKKIVTGSSDGTARIWKVSAKPLERTFAELSGEKIEYAAFSSTGRKFMVLISRDLSDDSSKYLDRAMMRMWSVTDGRIIETLTLVLNKWSHCVAISSDGEKVAAGGYRGIEIQNTQENKKKAQYISLQPSLSSGLIRCVIFSPDGMNIAASVNQVIQVWNLDTWKETALLRGHVGDIEQMAFSPDSTKLVTGSTDGTARIWNITSGAQLAVLKNYAGRSIAISPDGRMLAIGLFSNSVYLSSMENGTRLMIAEGHTQPVTMLSFSPASRFLLSADQSGMVLFWRVDVNGQVTKTPLGIYLAANEIGAVYWHDEQHVVLADLGGMQNHPHFYHLALEGTW